MANALETFLELFVLICVVNWYMFEAVVRWFFPQRKKDISGMTALVTGAGHGIGRCIALALAREGVKVVLWDINESKNNDVAQEIKDQNGEAYPFVCNVSDRTEVYHVASVVKQHVGDIDILVNNAGVVNGRLLLDCADEDIIRTMDINLMAHFWTTKTFLGRMKERNQGHIVAISSILGLIASSRIADYCASKSAVIGLMEALHHEVKLEQKDGVFFTTVLPSKVDTGLFDGCQGRFSFLPPTVQPEYIARKVVSAIQRNQDFVILPPWLTIVFAIKPFIPQKALDVIWRFTGVDDAIHLDRIENKKTT